MNIGKKYAAIMAGVAIISGLALAMPAFAQTNSMSGDSADSQGLHKGWSNGQWQGQGKPGMPGTSGMMHGTPPTAIGSVTAINGTTLTVTGRSFGKNAATTTYTVNASNATVVKNNATSTVSSIAVGDFVMVQGTASGTSVTATSIRDGMIRTAPGQIGKDGTKGPGGPHPFASTTLPIMGNGQPVVAGTVSAISGNTLTLTTKSNVTYTVDATNAKILQGQSTVSVSSIVVSDSVIVQGTVNGTSVTASTVIDQKAPTATGSNKAPGNHFGFFGSIWKSFTHLFGF